MMIMVMLSQDVRSVGAEIINGESVVLSEDTNVNADIEETIPEELEATEETENMEGTETIAEETEITEETETLVEETEITEEIKEALEGTENTVEKTETIEETETMTEPTEDVAVYSVNEPTEQSVGYAMVVTGTYEGDIALTIRHYGTKDGVAEALFLSDALIVKNGEKISDFYKYEEYYEIEKVTVSETNGTERILTAENGTYFVEVTEERAVVNVYYKEKTDNTFSSGVTMFDYADGRATNANSINYYKNYASYQAQNSSDRARPEWGGEDTDLTNDKKNWSSRFSTYGAASDYKLMVKNTDNENVNANAYNSKKDKQVIQGLLKNVSEQDYAKVNFTYEDPGFFTSESKAGKRVIDGYRLQFDLTGIRYELTQVFNPQNAVVYTKGEQFFPLKNETRLTGENANSGNYSSKNLYFGMRYDFEFVIGDYVGDMTYTFSGDDDLWVCMDGEVILDLGGIHGVVEGSVNIWEILLGTKNEITYEQKAEYLNAGDNKTLTHTITVLYMERGGNQSNCNMSFIMPNVAPKEPVVTEVPVAALELVKKNADTNAGIYGVGFTVYEDAACTIIKKAESFTDSEGKVSFTGLKEGTYYLKETYYDTQTYQTEDVVYTIIVTLNEEKTTATAALFFNGTEVSKDTTAYEIYNTPYVSFEFSKIDADSKNPIEGVEFKLYRESMEGTPLAVAISDEKGTVLFEKLTAGQYLLQETTPNGYVAVEHPWIVEIGYENGTYVQNIYDTKYNSLTLAWEKDGNAYTQQIIENTRAVGSLTITKTVDKVEQVHGTAAFLFQITCPDGSILYRTIPFSETDTNFTKSVTISNLALGDYTVEEISSVLRYTQVSPSEGKITKTVTVDGTVAAFENQKTFFNYYSHTDVLVNKVTFYRKANGDVWADLSVKKSSDGVTNK